MTKPASEKPVRGKALFTSYTVIWSMLGVLGLTYLGVAIFEPTWLGDLTPASARNGAETEEAMMNLSTDVAGLRSSMAKLQLDVASVRADVASQAGQTQMLGTQLSALEDKVRLGQTTIASAAVPTPPSATASTTQDASQAASTATMSMGAMDADSEPVAKPASKATKIINAAPAQPAPLVTGSVEPRAGTSKAKNAKADVISFGPAIVKPASKPIGIELASGPSVDGLRLSWSQITEQNQKLKKLTARYADNGDAANPGFNLIAGPVKSKAEAIRICKDLMAHYQTCKVGEFKGDEL
jgi:hypothetical protein